MFIKNTCADLTRSIQRHIILAQHYERKPYLIYISTLSHRNDNGVNERQKEKVRELGGTFIVTQRQTDCSPAALSPTSRDGSISSSRHTKQRRLKCFLPRRTHTHKKKTLNLRKPVATWLELRNVAASAAVIQQGGMGIVREREKNGRRGGTEARSQTDLLELIITIIKL